MLQIKWYIKSHEINQLPYDNPEYIPYVNPCIIVDNYNVFIIGGQTKNRTYLSTTWRAAFNVIPDQVSIENFFYTRGFLLNHVFKKCVRGNLENDKE